MTLNDLVQLATQRGTDRISLTRQADATREAAIFVMLLSKQSIRDIGPIAETFIRSHLPGEIHDPGHRLQLGVDQPISYVFDWLTAGGLNWSWGEHQLSLLVDTGTGRGRGLTQGTMNVLLLALVGTAHCRIMAPQLTARRCPTAIRP